MGLYNDPIHAATKQHSQISLGETMQLLGVRWARQWELSCLPPNSIGDEGVWTSTAAALKGLFAKKRGTNLCQRLFSALTPPSPH